ncbi:hypothetical protein F5I97DRAFT_1806848, partial [Phlebopus sp. FC_14]
RGVPINVAGKPRFWTKYGSSVTKGEGLTQAHVAKIVNADLESIVCVPEVYVIFSWGRCRFIVMQFVEGTTFAGRKLPKGMYKRDEMQAVANAVRRLVDIKMPAGTAPGPIGGGHIGHDFFLDSMSTIEYPTVEHLENQINAFATASWYRFEFQTETAKDLVLCLSDLNENNFMVDPTGKVWAIDFGRTCFLPPSFVYYSLRVVSNLFGRCVARLLNRPESPNFKAMDIASGLPATTPCVSNRC